VIDPARRIRLILARATLREILGRELALAPERVEIRRARSGRPLLVVDSGLSFSLSHSGRWAAVAVSRLVRVGVDIESISRRMQPALLRRLLARPEADAIGALSPEHQVEAFLAHWTAKEACAKVLDGGLAINLKRLELSGALDALRLRDPELAGLELVRLDLPSQLVGALAVHP
jgi:4'-phosphopantetheinyl transferase